jgi:hypothetical protein
MGLGGPSVRIKNSGILRYSFGGNILNPLGVFPQYQWIQGGASAVIINVLDSDQIVVPDLDSQVFGASAGHADVVGLPQTLFFGSTVAAQDAQAIGVPGTKYPSALYGTVQRGAAYVPASTKVHAYFVLTDASVGLSTAQGEEPLVAVQTQVATNRLYRNGVVDTTGPKYLGAVRVAVKNLGASTSFAAGVLVVELQHSEHDIPGTEAQSLFFPVHDTPIG